MIYIPTPDTFPPLTEEEVKLSMAKYYYRPIPPLSPVFEKAIDACVMPPEKIPAPEQWVDLMLTEGYTGTEFGYGMMENGAGYLAVYTVSHLPAEMNQWWFDWMGVPPKSTPQGEGNLCYKLWCPPDHVDLNMAKGLGKESLDLGQGDPVEDIYSYELTPQEMGMSEEKLHELQDAGMRLRVGYEKFNYPGTHIFIQVSRPCPAGGIESMNREWLGYGFREGQFYRDEDTPVTEEYLRKIVIHNTVETNRIEVLLPELYQEYKDQPLDCD